MALFLDPGAQLPTRRALASSGLSAIKLRAGACLDLKTRADCSLTSRASDIEHRTRPLMKPPDALLGRFIDLARPLCCRSMACKVCAVQLRAARPVGWPSGGAWANLRHITCLVYLTSSSVGARCHCFYVFLSLCFARRPSWPNAARARLRSASCQRRLDARLACLAAATLADDRQARARRDPRREATRRARARQLVVAANEQRRRRRANNLPD